MIRTAAILTTLLALAACNTVHGAGQDIQSAGQSISKEAAQTQQQM